MVPFHVWMSWTTPKLYLFDPSYPTNCWVEHRKSLVVEIRQTVNFWSFVRLNLSRFNLCTMPDVNKKYCYCCNSIKTCIVCVWFLIFLFMLLSVTVYWFVSSFYVIEFGSRYPFMSEWAALLQSGIYWTPPVSPMVQSNIGKVSFGVVVDLRGLMTHLHSPQVHFNCISMLRLLCIHNWHWRWSLLINLFNY